MSSRQHNYVSPSRGGFRGFFRGRGAGRSRFSTIGRYRGELFSKRRFEHYSPDDRNRQQRQRRRVVSSRERSSSPQNSSRDRDHDRDRSHHRSDRDQERDRSEHRSDRVDDDRDRKIKNLEHRLRDSDDTINGCRQLIANLEQRLRKTNDDSIRENEKSSFDSSIDSTPESKSTTIRNLAHLKMQVQTQAILLRKFKEENENVKLIGDKNLARWQMMKMNLNELATRTEQMKIEWKSMKEKIKNQFVVWNLEYEEVRDQITAVFDTGLISKALARSSIRMEGKIVVEERHLKELLETVLLNAKAVALDCQEEAAKQHCNGEGH